VTSLRVGLLLRATNLLLFAGWLATYRHTTGTLVSLKLPLALIAAALLINAGIAFTRRELSAHAEEAHLSSDILLLAWVTFWLQAWAVEVHLFLLLPILLAALHKSAGVTAVVTFLGCVAAAALSWSAPGDWLPVYGFRIAFMLLAAITVRLLAVGPVQDSPGLLPTTLSGQRTLLFNEFINHMLFQIRDYLTSVSTIIDHLGLTAKEPEVKDLSDKLRRTVGELNGKLGRMLDTVKANTTDRSGPLKVHFELTTLIEECLENAKASLPDSQARVKIGLDASIGTLQGDYALVSTALTAVIHNALEAVSPHGTAGRLRIKSALKGSLAIVDIADNGGGMSKELMSRLFIPLTTLKSAKGGMGLSLAMSRRMLERTGGTIRVKSVDGGTVVRIELPLKPALPIIRNEESTWAGRRAQS
jgi:signal transduction histidine kinase